MQTRFPKWKLLAFALLSVSDFVITYLLLSRNQDAVYEANPIANQWLQRGGWLGLAVFKATLVIVVMGIATYAYYRRPRIAHDLLAVCCGVVVVAVITGTSIAIGLAGPPQAAETTAAAHFSPHSSNGYVRQADYRELLDDAARDLAAHRIDLGRAVEVVREADLANNSDWIAALRRAYPGLEDRALIAADVLQQAVTMQLRTSAAKPLAERLEREFRDLYGVTPNLSYRQMLHLAPPNANGRAAVVAPSPAR